MKLQPNKCVNYKIGFCMALPGQDSDESLMVRVQNADHGAFATLVRRHTKMFFSAAYRMCNNAQTAEDIVQEAFLKLWDKPGAWNPDKGTKFTTWFYRVVTNMAIDRMRREKRFASPEVMDTIPDRTPAADAALLEKEKEAALEKALASLPDRQKAALNLCFYEGLSNREAAEVLGIGVKALESLLIRAKNGLKDELTRKGLLHDNRYERRQSHAG